MSIKHWDQRRKAIWIPCAGNPLWLRGQLSRIQNPQSFYESMAPQRNLLVTDPQFREVLDWIKRHGHNIQSLGDGILAFESPAQISMFLTRWMK